MELFISWSKDRSRQLAEIFRGWIPEIIQQVRPWMSSEDIDKGQQWSVEVGSKLAALGQGVLCITPENLSEPWLNFEAGALASRIENARVRPLLYGVAKSDVTGPLVQFQATDATDAIDMRRLVSSINAACATPLDDHRLGRAFDRNWDDYVNAVTDVLAASPAAGVPNVRRSNDELLREGIVRIRHLQRTIEMHPLIGSRPGWTSLDFLLGVGGTVMSGERVRHASLGDARFERLRTVKGGGIVAHIAPDATGEIEEARLEDVMVMRRWGPVRPEDLAPGASSEFRMLYPRDGGADGLAEKPTVVARDVVVVDDEA